MNSFTPYRAASMLFAFALLMVVLGAGIGVLSSIEYVLPGVWKPFISFQQLRPMHVSCIQFWIWAGGSASVQFALLHLSSVKPKAAWIRMQIGLWVIAILGILYAYMRSEFGGREYWEYNPVWSVPIVLSWICFLITFIRSAKAIAGKWPVYVWMWMTGIVFFLFICVENHLWLFEYFRTDSIKDMTIQWKVNGSIVGSWNQILYGTAFYIMDRISGDKQTGFSKTAFAMYFLGLFNLMFNWGHHVYTLPTAGYVRAIGYAVSMTEWVFFIRIVFSWKSSFTNAKLHYKYLPYRFILAADIWVCINMAQAICMSIPALNLYTHGTHVTVAHAMGTTIGINTMILLAAGFEFLPKHILLRLQTKARINHVFILANASLMVFFLALNTAGIIKGYRQMHGTTVSFAATMQDLKPWFIVFVLAGLVLAFCILSLVLTLFKAHTRKETTIQKINQIHGIRNLQIRETIQTA